MWERECIYEIAPVRASIQPPAPPGHIYARKDTLLTIFAVEARGKKCGDCGHFRPTKAKSEKAAVSNVSS